MKDGDPYPEWSFLCRCGGMIQLYWNGGELDQHKCKCGLWYWGEHQETVLRISEKSPWETE